MDFVNQANQGMGAIERAWAGLPGVKDYRNKELRRAADKQVRTTLATYLDTLRSRVTGMEQTLLSGGGLSYLPDLERAVGKLQLLIDRVRTASYGYAGFFDAQKVHEAQIEALVKFDQQLGQKASALENDIGALGQAMDKNQGISDAIRSLTGAIQALNDLFAQRAQVIQFADSPASSTITPPEAAAGPAVQAGSTPVGTTVPAAQPATAAAPSVQVPRPAPPAAQPAAADVPSVQVPPPAPPAAQDTSAADLATTQTPPANVG